jgi:hypothetical protein
MLRTKLPATDPQDGVLDAAGGAEGAGDVRAGRVDGAVAVAVGAVAVAVPVGAVAVAVAVGPPTVCVTVFVSDPPQPASAQATASGARR